MKMRWFFAWMMKLGAVSFGAFAIVIVVAPKPHLLDETDFSPCYVDRNGKLLRLGLAEDGRYRVYVPLEKIAPQLIEMTLLHEDRYFHEHAGFNPVALLRAMWSDARGQGRRLGASTITMQLARLHYHLNTRTIGGKLAQIVAAIHLECHCSKHEILEAYLNLAPYGRNIEGVGGASLIYFGKEPAELGPVEAMTLAVIPQSPARRSPGTAAHEMALRRAREILLAQWLGSHPEDGRLRGVLAMPLQMKLPRDLPFRAPHLVEEMLLRDAAPRAETRLALDLDLQDVLEREVKQYLAARATDGFKNACALLVDYRTMEVRAAVGSADFRREDIDGQVDGLRAQRSPGSALKPFIYALAMDEGLIHPNSLLKDAPASFDGYDPENFDHNFAGPIRATDALIQSRNVPAVDLESRLDPGRNLYTLLRDAGIRRLQPESHYGLTIALGSAEVSPEEIGTLYAMLANRGVLRPLRLTPDDPAGAGAPLLSPEAAYLTLDMLKEAARPGAVDVPRLLNETRPVAWKTGTSFSYRDAWSAGVFDNCVLVVWVGNFDGTANPEFIGRTAAAPLLFRVIDALRARFPQPAPVETCFTRTPDLNLRQVDLCAVSGMIAGPNCSRTVKGWFIPGKSPIAPCDVHRRVWVDNLTGLRLSNAPDDPSTAHAEVCEFWPSDLEKLFQAAGLPRAGPPPVALRTGSSLVAHDAGDGPRIVSPKAGLVYHVRVGAEADEVLNLEATAETSREHLHWFVDAAYLGVSAPSAGVPWKLQPGRHVIRAVDDLGRADSRRIIVTAVE
ncbi:MAG TPA: penicillin-binding protein 1C [Candidatus Methylacidiphilales bacterium]|jgi:penicillin-binding protein 1C|nr:penicillin-binding protein 1C [Candidatus Methylacidiphilales bacterium]